MADMFEKDTAGFTRITIPTLSPVPRPKRRQAPPATARLQARRNYFLLQEKD
jgi:hypothetical protein